MKKQIFACLAVLSLTLISEILLAQNSEDCKFPHYLSLGFDIEHFRECDSLMKQCPGNGFLHNKNCVDGVVRKNKSCDQFRKLIADLGLPANQVTVVPLAEFALVTVTFPGDGQFNYKLISPNGCLINTKIDPRKLDPSLNEKYPNTSFKITSWGEPQYQSNPDGTPSITSVLKITDKCIGCPLIGYAKIKFDFDKHGNLVKKSLVSFDQNYPQK